MYIFLDIDGVLVKEDDPNDDIYMKTIELEEDLLRFHQDCLNEFESIIRQYQHTKIVISSSWRENFAFESIKASLKNKSDYELR